MAWVGANKDMLSLLIALLAILVSLSTALINLRNLRTNSFVAMQNVMLNGELQRGRLLVYRAIATGEVPPRDCCANGQKESRLSASQKVRRATQVSGAVGPEADDVESALD